MTKVNWSKAPANTEFWACGFFYKTVNGKCMFYAGESYEWVESAYSKSDLIDMYVNFYDKPIGIVDANKKVWPDESRIDIIGTNGNTGEAYVHYELNKPREVRADEILSEGLQILTQRGEQYGSEQRECSFPQAAEAFNALTGHNIKGSDVCLILALVKQVRQHAQDRYHHDSAVDGVNYLALQAQELAKERK